MAKLTVSFPACEVDGIDRGTVIDHRIATETVDQSKAVYELTTGKCGVADASSAGKHTFAGINLHQKKYAGQACAILRRGLVSGYDVSGLNVGSLIYLDTTGDLADAANGTTTVPVGRVVGTTRPNDDGTLQKLIEISVDVKVNY